LRLASFIWPEQRERLARLRAACAAVAGWQAAEDVAVEAATASRFVARELATRRRGVATVLMHSVVWQYLGADEQAGITAAIEAAGARATPDAPLAWLTLEPPAPEMGVQLGCRIWDGAAQRGARRLLARAHPHGARIAWLESA
ncbi:MAG: DUF2332 family protein, partial [Burkholderiales bacterium]|nr:DUF2332 family protein [Burkholderiales bacterium]